MTKFKSLYIGHFDNRTQHLLRFFSVLLDTIGQPRVPTLVHVDSFVIDVVMREDDGGDMGMFTSVLSK